MPLQLAWDDAYNSTIRCDFDASWSWTELEQAMKDVAADCAKLSYDIHVIWNNISFPRGISPFQQINHVRRLLPPNTGSVIAVTRKSYVKIILSVANRFYESDSAVKIVANLDEARALLAEVAATRRWQQSLIENLGSDDLALALQAVEELRSLEWLYDGSLEGLSLQGANLQGADLFMANLQGADLRTAQLQGTNLFMANLIRAKLQKANMAKAILTEAKLAGANLEEAHLWHAEVSPADLTHANLRSASLWSINLLGSTLDGAVLDLADIRRARLAKASLRGASLRGAFLQGAHLVFAQCERANLSGSSMEHADMRGCNLERANLRAANLTEANLSTANLAGADLNGAYLGDAQLNGANFSPETILPDGSHWTPQSDVNSFTDPANPVYMRRPLRRQNSRTLRRSDLDSGNSSSRSLRPGFSQTD